MNGYFANNKGNGLLNVMKYFNYRNVIDAGSTEDSRKENSLFNDVLNTFFCGYMAWYIW